jgi:histidyl-tRNA synthetase
MIPGGTRDFYDQDYEKKNYIISTIEKFYRKYGYRPLETPAFEMLSTLIDKGGSEIKDQIFVFDSLALRFDHTVPLIRFVKMRSDLPRPVKRYAIGKVWRNEDPQKNRYIEFTQADIDIVGAKDIISSLELLEIMENIFKEFNLPIQINVNHREFLNAISKDIPNREIFFRIIDKMDRFDRNYIEKELERNGIDKYYLQNLEKITLEDVKLYSEKAYEDLKAIGRKFNPFLVRGLDYYTGEIFEIRSMGITVGGGGRYSLFGERDNTGISIGVDRVYNIMNFNPNRKIIYIAWLDYEYAKEIANKIRDIIDVDMNISNRSLRKQLEYASKLYRYCIIVGEKEKLNNTVILRDLRNSKEKIISKDLLKQEIENLYR